MTTSAKQGEFFKCKRHVLKRRFELEALPILSILATNKREA
jgi:hypothetical protein